jgi:hypothetical protein
MHVIAPVAQQKNPYAPQQKRDTVATAQRHPFPPHARRYTVGATPKSFPPFLTQGVFPLFEVKAVFN